MYHYSHGIVNAVFQGWVLIQIYVVSLELKWYPVETAFLAVFYRTSSTSLFCSCGFTNLLPFYEIVVFQA